MPTQTQPIAERPIRVLIVDDSAVARRIVRTTLEEDADLEVSGFASNGKLALDRIAAIQSDVVTLDIEMPEMNGLEALDRIHELYPSVKVIMLSTLTQSGAAMTIEALSRGADDYVSKPSGTTSIDNAIQLLRQDLVPKIKRLCRDPTPRVHRPLAARPRGKSKRVDIVAIAVSTGGPNALAEIIPRLPADLPCPVVITQHMPAMFTRLLAERLDEGSQVKVEEAQEGSIAQPGKVLIAPGGHHMCFRRSGTQIIARLDDGPEEHSCRPSANVMFRSVGEIWGGSVLAVMLTGMGAGGSGLGSRLGDVARYIEVKMLHPETGRHDIVVVQASSEGAIPESSGLLVGKPVYTVYLDVGAPKPWILQYAVPTQADSQQNQMVVQLGNPAPVVAPYPMVTYLPHVTPDGRQGYVMLHGFLAISGRLEELRLVRGAKSDLEKILVPILKEWEFRPASRDGLPVRVEVLVAIPRYKV